MEAFLDAAGPVAQLGRQRRPQLQLGRRDDRAETERGRRTGQAGQEERLGLAGGQPGQTGAVAVEQLISAGRTGVTVDRHARLLQGLDVAIDRADGDLQLGRERGRRQPARGSARAGGSRRDGWRACVHSMPTYH